MWKAGLGASPSRGHLGAGLAKAALVGAMLCLGGTPRAETLAALPTMVSLPASSGSLDRGSAKAKPVSAWFDFCNRYPAECAVDTSEPVAIVLTPEIWRTIVAVNRRVNRDVKPMNDMAHWGVVDHWDLAEDGLGDCEDYQLLKRKRLVEGGLPRRALRMTVVIDEINEGHAVLMVRTDRGDFILDNKTNTVLPWHQTGYTFVKREGQDSRAWVALNGVTSPVTTANR